MRFSERYGHRAVREALQIDEMDTPLRNGLWDCFTIFTDELDPLSRLNLYRIVWRVSFEETVDSLPRTVDSAKARIRAEFFRLTWHGVYDFVETFVEAIPIVPNARPGLPAVEDAINRTLKGRGSGYRIVNHLIVPITDETSLEAVKQAIDSAPNAGARQHLSKALGHLANRQSPDYANSIKESISAVESICNQIVGNSTTLGDALNRMEKAGITVHPALKEGWKKLYGYTSDADGIRHSSLDLSSVDSDDALYFLVTCSAFVNLLVSKAAALLSLSGD